MYKIGELSRLTGIKVPTIRYFEQVGLIEHTKRNHGNQRLYKELELEQLRFIKRSRELGFSQAEIKVLLGKGEANVPNCGDVLQLAKNHLQSVRDKIRDLRKIEKHLLKVSKECKNAESTECPIINALYVQAENTFS